MDIDSKGTVWISSGYRLYKYNPKTEVIIPLINDDLLSIWNFYIDSRDRVWGGGYGSICMFDGDMYKRFYFDDPNVLARSIGEDTEGNRIGVDPEDNVWASLVSYAPGSPKMVFLNKGNWVTESLEMIKVKNAVTDFAFPDKNTIWIATTGGIFEFKK